jgi:hypothetical protein
MAFAVTSAPWQQVNMPALDLRRMIKAAVGGEGVVAAGDLAVAQRGAGANMSVDIAAGEAYVLGESVTNQGLYYVYNDAVYNLTGFTAAHATLPRIDRVAIRVRDAFHGDAANDEAAVILTGTATSGATLANLTGAAAVPANHMLLANVLIPATSTTITTANIDTTVRARSGPAGTVLAYNEFTVPVTCTATTEATSNTIVTASAVTFDGATAILVEFFAPAVKAASSALTAADFTLWDGTTDLGLIGSWGNDAASNNQVEPLSLARRFTPASGSRVYSVRGRSNIAAGTLVNAGTWGPGTYCPGYICVTKA